MKCCCVPYCKNGRVLKYTKQIKFYFFPKAFDEESASRRSKWIKAVNKINPNGSAWEPRQYTQICSQHFVSNEASEDPDSPSYIPTLRLSQTVVVAYNHVRPKSAQTSLSNTTLTPSASSSSLSTISPKKLRQHSVTQLNNNSSSSINNNNNDVFLHQQPQQQQQMTLSSSDHQSQMNRNLLLTDEDTKLIALQTSANINRLSTMIYLFIITNKGVAVSMQSVFFFVQKNNNFQAQIFKMRLENIKVVMPCL
ncbi:hypothetical protein HELRODRAFT_168764 [Helobdella robusta]|uniref:THAP-type domain-containing protein n=1 Tax=Helobdella robusta TaxID=6412 RepID=T1F0X9_HELRO|nr:hypothetical protein HELRODRAFT_168764 [Helobdella robusta]ESO08852.1 hypothetical protein HELRODRAFT_168764 [Helobdella robusta]